MVLVLLEKIQDLLEDKQLIKIETVQSLWSGYGEIARYFSPGLNTNVIVKHINPPEQVSHPRGWNTQISHQRKLKSYQVELHFYQDYAQHCDEFCIVPKLIASSMVDNSSHQQSLMILQDLDHAGFSKRKTQVNIEGVKQTIKWLAYFHAKFLNTSVEGLWSVGTYWHLATRPDELAAMADGELKHAAQKIDEVLNKAKYQTLVHGDAKLANFCFADGSSFTDDISTKHVAAVDFQYVGQGVGVKDLMYLLGGALTEQQLFDQAPNLLDEYFSQLNNAILEYKVDVDFAKLEQEWLGLYSFAWADFHRFLLGWSPEHFKINTYMQSQTDIALLNLA